MNAWTLRDAIPHSVIHGSVPNTVEFCSVNARAKFEIDQPCALSTVNSNEMPKEGGSELITEVPQDCWSDFELESFRVKKESIKIEDNAGEMQSHRYSLPFTSPHLPDRAVTIHSDDRFGPKAAFVQPPPFEQALVAFFAITSGSFMKSVHRPGFRPRF